VHVDSFMQNETFRWFLCDCMGGGDNEKTKISSLHSECIRLLAIFNILQNLV
jgi:hypothetical protein